MPSGVVRRWDSSTSSTTDRSAKRCNGPSSPAVPALLSNSPTPRPIRSRPNSASAGADPGRNLRIIYDVASTPLLHKGWRDFITSSSYRTPMFSRALSSTWRRKRNDKQVTGLLHRPQILRHLQSSAKDEAHFLYCTSQTTGWGGGPPSPSPRVLLSFFSLEALFKPSCFTMFQPLSLPEPLRQSPKSLFWRKTFPTYSLLTCIVKTNKTLFSSCWRYRNHAPNFWAKTWTIVNETTHQTFGLKHEIQLMKPCTKCFFLNYS